MDTANQLIETKTALEITAPSAESLMLEADTAKSNAEILAVYDEESLQLATAEMNKLGARVKELEKLRKAITKPIDDAKKKVMDLFKPAVARYTEGIDIIKHGIKEYVDEEERKAAQLRIEAEKKAAEQRAELEAKAQAADAAGAADVAEAMRESAAMLVADPAVQKPAKVAGMSTRKVWKATVTDLSAFLKYAAEHPEIQGCVEVNAAAIARFITATGGTASIPGVEAHQETQITNRS